MTYKTINDFDMKDKRVIVRVDLNVPAKDGKVTDVTRITRLKPTIKALKEKGAKIILLSHFGRPDGKIIPEMSLGFLAQECARIWDETIFFASDFDHAQENNEAITLCENVRFYEGEEKNAVEFAARLATLGDIFINDAFSCAHRAHASTTGIAKLLPHGAGLLMVEELTALSQALEKPERPVCAIVGGSKISTKLDLLSNMITKMDHLILGGGMANTFLMAKGVDVGTSLVEENMLPKARAIMEMAKMKNCIIHLPVDVAPDYTKILDIGPQTIEEIKKTLLHCKTVLWNGPLGLFEQKPYDTGTVAVAKMIAGMDGLTSICGGGDTVAALELAGVTDKMTYVSTAGGAFLEFCEGKTLPGVAALYN